MILSTISLARYNDFCPVIYVIDTRRVIDKCIEVNSKDKARYNSIEYKITNLDINEFELIQTKLFYEQSLSLLNNDLILVE